MFRFLHFSRLAVSQVAKFADCFVSMLEYLGGTRLSQVLAKVVNALFIRPSQ